MQVLKDYTLIKPLGRIYNVYYFSNNFWFRTKHPINKNSISLNPEIIRWGLLYYSSCLSKTFLLHELEIAGRLKVEMLLCKF